MKSIFILEYPVGRSTACSMMAQILGQTSSKYQSKYTLTKVYYELMNKLKRQVTK